MSVVGIFRGAPRPRPGIRFVLVNNRIPRMKTGCALCGANIEQPYARELHTGLLYCDPQCLAGHQAITRSVRMAS